MPVFNKRKDHTKAKMFLDPNGGPGIQRYDVVKYRQFEKLTENQLGFFWLPQEVNVVREAADFRSLTAAEQHMFTSNIKRQIVLDTEQGRSPSLAFLPLVGLPELETWIETWTWNETIHSRSYTHIIRNIYSDPSAVFDDIRNIKEITDCAETIDRYYDELIEAGRWYNLLGEGTHTINGEEMVIDLYELKKKIWLAIMAVNILEGVRFYVSFACSWAFAELKKMEGNAKIIKFIVRDENVHLAGTQQMLKLLQEDDKDFAKIAKETVGQCTDMFMEAVQQEKDWADYLFKDGSMIGLNAQLLKDYIEWIAAKRMRNVGLTAPYQTTTANPLPWTQKWISGGDVQVAPQETEISSYIVGGTISDVDENTFKGMDL